MVFSPTSRAKLHDAERYWLAKSCMRVSTIIAALVAIGCMAWATSPFHQIFSENFYLIPWNIIPLGVSVLWNITNIAVLLSRQKPVHPGANVGMDLVLWLVLSFTAAAATVAAVAELQWFSNIYYYDGDSWQNVILSNGTEVYEYGYYTTDPNGTDIFIPGNSSASCPGYSSCAQLNQLSSKHRQLGVVELVGCVFCYIVVLLHFALFVWACVDTHRRRSGKVNDRAQKIAQAIIADMTTRGLLPTSQMRQQEEPLLVNSANAGIDSEAPVVLPSVPSQGAEPPVVPPNVPSREAEPLSTFYHDGPPQISLPPIPPMRETRFEDPDVITAAPMRYA